MRWKKNENVSSKSKTEIVPIGSRTKRKILTARTRKKSWKHEKKNKYQCKAFEFLLSKFKVDISSTFDDRKVSSSLSINNMTKIRYNNS